VVLKQFVLKLAAPWIQYAIGKQLVWFLMIVISQSPLTPTFSPLTSSLPHC
jgi:hypothetical protein